MAMAQMTNLFCCWIRDRNAGTATLFSCVYVYFSLDFIQIEVYQRAMYEQDLTSFSTIC